MSLVQVLRRSGVIAPGMAILVAVSGGADSLALLRALVGLRRAWRLRLHVATIDHGWRGIAGAADAEYVRAMALSWRVGCTIRRGDARALGAGEDAARRLRYALLSAIAAEQQMTTIATGHHHEDQAETVLMHLLRGSGIRGLGAIAPTRRMDTGITLIRPLLHTPRARIDAYCRAQGIRPRHDASNDDPRYLRNRVRGHLLPVLRAYNPQIAGALSRLADAARDDDAYLTDAALRQIERAALPHEPPIAMALEWLRSHHPALRRRILLWACERVCGGLTIPAERIDALDAAIAAGRGDVRIELPGGASAILRAHMMIVQGVKPVLSSD